MKKVWSGFCFSMIWNVLQGCALAAPGGPWHLHFALGRLDNHSFVIAIIF